MQQNCNKIINTHYIYTHITNSLSDYGTPQTCWSFAHAPIFPICTKLDSMHPRSIMYTKCDGSRFIPRFSLFTRIITRNVLNRQRMHTITNMPPLIRTHDNDDVRAQQNTLYTEHIVYTTLHLLFQTAFMVSWPICGRGSSTNINGTESK